MEEKPDKTLDYRTVPPNKKGTRWGLILGVIGVVVIVLLLAMIA